jgi:hypothetical protein
MTPAAQTGWRRFCRRWVASDFAKQIGHQSLASPGALDIANIPQGFKHLLVLGKLRGQGGGPAGTTWMQVNADAGANYQWQTATASGATFAAGSNTDNGWLLTDTMDVATDSQMAPFRRLHSRATRPPIDRPIFLFRGRM